MATPLDAVVESLISQELGGLERRGLLLTHNDDIKWGNLLAEQRLLALVPRLGQPAAVNMDAGGFAVFGAENLRETGFVRIEIGDVAALHLVPAPHVDFMRAVIRAEVPADRVDDVRALSDSVAYDVARRELSATCHFMGANMATLWLAKRVASGRMSLVEARRSYGPAINQTLRQTDAAALWYRMYASDLGVAPLDDNSVHGLRS